MTYKKLVNKLNDNASKYSEAHEKTYQEGFIDCFKELEPLIDALKFYADYMNYSVDYDTSYNGFSRRCILYKDIEEINEATGLAGMRAREALKKVGIE